MGGAPTMSQAEVADRLTILELKYENGLHARGEHTRLASCCQVPESMMNQLRRINRQGWDAVGRVTEHFEGRAVLIDSEIIEQCRRAHASNKERIAMKNEISRWFGGSAEAKTWAR